MLHSGTGTRSPRILRHPSAHPWEDEDLENIVYPHEGVGKMLLLKSGKSTGSIRNPCSLSSFEWHTTESRRRATRTSSNTKNLQQRLANANDYFRRKASEVFNDNASLKLLEGMYQDVVVEISEFDACEHGLALAKLTAASFCEVGANVIYITEAGQRFIDSIRESK